MKISVIGCVVSGTYALLMLPLAAMVTFINIIKCLFYFIIVYTTTYYAPINIRKILFKLMFNLPDLPVRNKYPLIYVHGFSDFISPYYLNVLSNLYNIHNAHVGLFSSNYVCAVQLFYTIKGGLEDFGPKYDKKCKTCKINRYGIYRTGVHPEWNQHNPIHIVGYSNGGNVIKVLQMLLESNNRTKLFCNIDGVPYNTNALWIRSMTTICGSYNGLAMINFISDPVKNKYGIEKQVINKNKIAYKIINYLYPYFSVFSGIYNMYFQDVSVFDNIVTCTKHDTVVNSLSIVDNYNMNKRFKYNSKITYFHINCNASFRFLNVVLPRYDISSFDFPLVISIANIYELETPYNLTMDQININDSNISLGLGGLIRTPNKYEKKRVVQLDTNDIFNMSAINIKNKILLYTHPSFDHHQISLNGVFTNPDQLFYYGYHLQYINMLNRLN